jgi:ribosomal protein S27E
MVKKKANTSKPICSCVQDPYADLPPELRPRPAQKTSSLRKVTCPGCGLVYWTNRKTELCVDCEKKGIKIPSPSGG